MITLQTPIQSISEIEVVSAQRTDSWNLVLKLGDITLPISIKSQPSNRQVKRNEDGSSKNDGDGALETEEIAQPDLIDILRIDSIGTQRIEAIGVLELFDLIEAEEGVEAALIQCGIVPASLAPTST